MLLACVSGFNLGVKEYNLMFPLYNNNNINFNINIYLQLSMLMF